MKAGCEEKQIEILKREAKGGDANIEVKVAEIDIALGKTGKTR